MSARRHGFRTSTLLSSIAQQDARLYLDPVRECYEAYVIYNFYAYLMNFLEVGGSRAGDASTEARWQRTLSRARHAGRLASCARARIEHTQTHKQAKHTSKQPNKVIHTYARAHAHT